MSSDWFQEQRGGAAIEVAAFLTPEVLDAVTALLELGCLVSLSTSRDGGALSMTVTYDGRWRREWFRDHEAAAAWLSHAVEAVTGMASMPAPSGTVRRLNGPGEARGRRKERG